MLTLLLLLAAPPKIAFVAGFPNPKLKPGEHEYHAGCQVLAGLARQSGVTATVHKGGWPTDPAALDGVSAVVLFVEGGDKNLVAEGDRLSRLEKLSDAGAGLVFLHSAIDFDAKHADRVKRLAGGVWVKGGKRAHWVAGFDAFPKHPIFAGVTPFSIDDGWLWNSQRDATTVPLLKTVGPKDNGQTTADGSVVAWASERPEGKGRAFVFTGGHLHDSLAKEGYRRFLTNGVLWAARQPVPDGGAPVALDPAELTNGLDK
jgi:type 1 glutamine amidotransferase